MPSNTVMVITEALNSYVLLLNLGTKDDLTPSSPSHHNQAVAPPRVWFISTLLPLPWPRRTKQSQPTVPVELVGPRLLCTINSVSTSPIGWACWGHRAHTPRSSKAVEEMNEYMGEKSMNNSLSWAPIIGCYLLTGLSSMFRFTKTEQINERDF